MATFTDFAETLGVVPVDYDLLDNDYVIDEPQLQHGESKEDLVPQTMPGCGVHLFPVEIILKIYESLDLESAFRLSETCKKLHEAFRAHSEVLTLTILSVELSPFDELLQCIVQTGEDLAVPLGPCLRRRIYHGKRLVSEGERPALSEEAHELLPPVSLDQEHFRRLISTYRLIKDWEQLFPQYRFRACLSDCRELRPHEKKRLRAALYQWMSYAQYFHGDFKRPSRFLPEARSMDIRCQKLRMLSTVKLIELEDLWETVVSIVSCHVCPSTEQVMMENHDSLSLHDAEKLSFGSTKLILRRRPFGLNDGTPPVFAVNNSIVETFLKLSPGDILRFATSRFVYTRDKVVREVRLSYPSILQDQQTFGHALAAVMGERHEEGWNTPREWEWKQMSLVPSAEYGGILDIPRSKTWPEADDVAFRQSLDTGGERALSWQMDGGFEMEVRGARLVERGRLEP